MARRRGHRRNPEVVGAVVSEARKAFTPSSFKNNVFTGAQAAIGYGAVSAVGSALNRIGAGMLLAKIPEGVARTLVGYGFKGFTVGIVALGARLAGIRGSFGENINAGAKANFGVTVLRDVAGAIPGGGRIRAFLSGGVGDYIQADGWPAMGDYLNTQMQPTLPSPELPPTDGIYGRNSEMYGGDGSIFS